jgi:hypothetical protein
MCAKAAPLMRYFAVVLVCFISFSGWAETIAPYASEAELGALIGENAKVVGVFHQNAFGAPAIAISGRVFFLLETPPSKHTFDFPKHSRKATVRGTLYLYDGRLQFSDSYQAFGDRYYFFNIDAAKIDFGEPITASGEDPLESIIGDWRFDMESTEAEIVKFEKEEIREDLTTWVQVFRDSEMVVQRNRIRTYMPWKEDAAADFPEIVSGLTALAARYVLEGRSTLGPKLEYVSGDWKQIDWVD